MDVRYILEVKSKGFADGLCDRVREMKDTRMTSRFLATVARRMIGSTSYQNGETGVGGRCESQWNGEELRVPL